MSLYTRKDVILYLLWGVWASGLGGYMFFNNVFNVNQVITLIFISPLLLLLYIMVKTVFKKRTNIDYNNSNKTPLAADKANVPLNSFSENTVRKSTIVAVGTQLKGDVDLDGDIHIHGVIIGNINVNSGTVNLMNGGYVEGNLSAPHITVDGCVEGVCTSSNLEILEHGRLKGIVKTTHFSIKKGGIFIGQSEVVTDEANNQKNIIKPELSFNQAEFLSEKQGESIGESIKEVLATKNESAIDDQYVI